MSREREFYFKNDDFTLANFVSSAYIVSENFKMNTRFESNKSTNCSTILKHLATPADH